MDQREVTFLPKEKQRLLEQTQFFIYICIHSECISPRTLSRQTQFNLKQPRLDLIKKSAKKFSLKAENF